MVEEASDYILSQVKLNPENVIPAAIAETLVAKRKTRKAKTDDAASQQPDTDKRVWVKCIVDLKPWAEDKPLELWQDYHLKADEAILLEERRFVVILTPPEET